MKAFATVNDLITLFRPLSPEEVERAQSLLDAVSARLRQEAFKTGRDLDRMIETEPTGSLAYVTKSVTVDVTGRMLNTPTEGELSALSQYSQAGLGYTVSGTFASGGGGIFIKKSELAALGIRRPRYGTVSLAGNAHEEET